MLIKMLLHTHKKKFLEADWNMAPGDKRFMEANVRQPQNDISFIKI